MKANVTLILLVVALLFLCSSRSSNAQVHFNEQPPARLDQPWKQLQQQQDGDVGLKVRTRTRRMQRRQAVTIDFSGPRSTTTTAAAAPTSSSESSSSIASSSFSIISSPTSSSSSSSVSDPPPSFSTSSPPFSASAPTAAPSPSTLNLSTTQQLFADLPNAVLIGADVEDLPGPASGVPALIPGLVALLIILGLWSTRKKLACPFTLILLSNVFLTIAALTLLISTTRGPSALAALLCSASTVTRCVWLALAAKFLFKASLAPPNQRSTSPRPEIFGFSSSSLPGSPDQVQRSRYAVVRIIVWVLILALGTFETAWRLAIVLSSHDLSMGLMCTANVLQALLLVVLVVAVASTARNGAHEAGWRRRGASFAIGACCIGFAIAVTNMALHGFSEAPLGRLLLLVENLLFLVAATMLALPFESRDGLPRRLSLRRTGTAPPPYRNRSMSEKVKERRGPPPTVPPKAIEGASPRNGTVRSPALKSTQRKSAPANLPIHPLILSGAAHQQTADTSLSAPTSPSLTTTSPDVTQDRPELLRSNSSPNGCRTNVLLPPSTFDPTQYTVLRPNSTLTATSDERHAHSAIIVAAAPAPAPERDVARMVSLTRGRSKGGRSINSPDSSRTSLPPPVPAKLRRDTTRSSTFSAHSTVESSRGACGEDILDHFPTPPPSSRACGGVPASVRNSAAMSELSERVELAYAQGEDEIYVLPEAPGLRRSSSRTHVSVTSFMSTLAARSGLSALRQTHTPSSSSMAPSSDAVHAPAPLPTTASPVPASPKLTLEPTSDPADAATMHYGTSPPRTLLLLPEVTLANSDTSSMYVDDSGVWDVPVSPGLPRSRGGSNRSSLTGSASGAAKVDSPSTSTKADLGHAQAHAHSASSGQLLSPVPTPTGWKRYSNTSIAASPLRRSFDTSAVSSEKEEQQVEDEPMQRSSLYMTPRNSIRTPPGWTKEADE